MSSCSTCPSHSFHPARISPTATRIEGRHQKPSQTNRQGSATTRLSGSDAVPEAQHHHRALRQVQIAPVFSPRSFAPLVPMMRPALTWKRDHITVFRSLLCRRTGWCIFLQRQMRPIANPVLYVNQRPSHEQAPFRNEMAPGNLIADPEIVNDLRPGE